MHWTGTTVKSILRNEVYLGHMVQNKTGNVGFRLQAGRKERKEPHKQQRNNGIVFGTAVLCGLRKSDALLKGRQKEEGWNTVRVQELCLRTLCNDG